MPGSRRAGRPSLDAGRCLAARTAGRPGARPGGAVRHRIADSREGWAKAVELLEAMAFRRERDRSPGARFLRDPPRRQRRSAACRGARVRAGVAAARLPQHPPPRDRAARARDPDGEALQPWEQALLLDHYLSVEVQVGGARRAARMATKSWRDPGVLRFIRAKEAGGLWTANHSVMVDARFLAPRARRRRGRSAEPPRPARCSPRRPAAPGSTASRASSTATGWRITAPASPAPVRWTMTGASFGSARYQVDARGAAAGGTDARARPSSDFPATTNPCGEITLHVTGGYCVIADFAPLLACPVPFEDVAPGAPPPDGRGAVGCAGRGCGAPRRALPDAREPDGLAVRAGGGAHQPHGHRPDRAARICLAAFRPRLRRSAGRGRGPRRSGRCWSTCRTRRRTRATRIRARARAARPVTVTTVKPSGTISKLFGLTEGAHLPARRAIPALGAVQGHARCRRPANGCRAPIRCWPNTRRAATRCATLRSFPGMTIVGFPTVPLIMRLGLAERLVTAPEATPAQQYRWLRLLERYWIGAEQGNQVSYTLKLYTDRHDLDEFRAIVLREQPGVRCCAMLPSRPDHALGYEYLPEEDGVGRGVRGAGRRDRRCRGARGGGPGASAMRQRGVPDLTGGKPISSTPVRPRLRRRANRVAQHRESLPHAGPRLHLSRTGQPGRRHGRAIWPTPSPPRARCSRKSTTRCARSCPS